MNVSAKPLAVRFLWRVVIGWCLALGAYQATTHVATQDVLCRE